jgi:hypothetical protein
MTYWTRFWIGGGGALLPLLVTLLAVDIGPLIDNAPHLTIGTYVGAAIRYLVLFTIGGIVAALNSDEVQPIKLVQLGIAAPALISTYVNAQPPKPLSGQTAATHSAMFSLDVISSARAADAVSRGDGRILMAGFFSDVLQGATSPLSRVAPPTSPVPHNAAVNLAIENARTSAASAAAAAEKAASDASKLDLQSTSETISSVQKSAEDARTAAQKAQSDLNTLGDLSKGAVAR